MFETRRLSSKIILQVVLTIMVIPFLLPLIAMVQESLSGQGWGNYRAVWAPGSSPISSATAPSSPLA
jgi:raffinose/stachyose/melibiose transport system permease protein